MSQTVYNVNPPKALEGMPVAWRKVRPLTLPLIAQVTQGVLALAEAGDIVHTVTDLQSGQVYTLTTTFSTGTLATSLDELVASWQASGKLNDLFSITENGVDTYTLTARHADRAYEVTSVPPGSMTDTITTPTAAAKPSIKLGRFVAQDSSMDFDAFRALQAGDTIDDIVGAVFRKDANHFHSLENDTYDAFDKLDGGRTLSVMEDGRIWFKSHVEAMPLQSSVYVVIDGSGEIGGVRATADGGNTVDITSICKVEIPAEAAGDLVQLRIDLQP